MSYERASKYLVPNSANPKAIRGGINFDGTTNAKVLATLTGQNIGTDDCTLVATFRVPATVPVDIYGQWIMAIGPSTVDIMSGSSVAGFGLSIDTNGALLAGLQDNSTYSYRVVSNFVALFGGKVVTIKAVRSGSANIAIYINGVLQTTISIGGSLSYATSITSTYLMIGSRGTSYSTNSRFLDTIYSVSVYNLALSATDVKEIYESGGAVPFRFQYGTQTVNYTSDFSAGVDSWISTVSSVLTGTQTPLIHKMIG